MEMTVLIQLTSLFHDYYPNKNGKTSQNKIESSQNDKQSGFCCDLFLWLASAR